MHSLKHALYQTISVSNSVLKHVSAVVSYRSVVESSHNALGEKLLRNLLAFCKQLELRHEAERGHRDGLEREERQRVQINRERVERYRYA